MAKFLAELLGCTLPSKGASPMFESKSHSRVGLKSSTKQKTTIFSTLASEKSLSDCKKEQQWKPSMYSSITPVCFPSPLIEKPIDKVRMNVLLSDTMIRASWLLFLFALSYFGEIIKLIL
ncbi:RASGEF1B isoform 11 [Pan troglodytes]|uniref:RASGEF1B isoform 11 n=1 Tax=Pan troglodytes TaxID=9598 RepID=A0A2J8PG48_PANTR|nr:RASGEF1B isoform 11 [Pan troglodytes]